MKLRTTLLATTLAVATLSGCASASASGATVIGTDTADGRAHIYPVSFEPGIECDVLRGSVLAYEVSCDYSALEGTDISTVANQEAAVMGTSVALTNLEDHLCVSVTLRRSAGISCYYP